MSPLDDALTEATRDKRVCPQPSRWAELYELLPERHRSGAGWEPALPLILATWYETPALMKALRLREHLEWDADHGALAQVHSFMASLPEDEWFHYGD